MSKHALLALTFLCFGVCATTGADEKLGALIIDGQNNHTMWPKTTVMMKKYLEDTGLFKVDVARTGYTWRGEDLLAKYPLRGVQKTTPTKEPQSDPNFRPNFADYNVVVSNYNGAAWPVTTQRAFVEFVRGGGGYVVVHAANNAFGDWKEYNQVIGLGGWNGRNQKSGPYVFFDSQGKLTRDTTAGPGGHHGPQHEFQIIVRDGEHPITRGMPREWMHAKDELYDLLRGPAQGMQILATAYADKGQDGSGRHEPMMLTVRYGKGRVFHTPMGHADYSQECVGFMVSLQRGAEWAATGQVTQNEIPQDFPRPDQASRRKFD